jgi:molybdopterin-containing oxidoreductase family iron-sulfur binding subunit
MSCDRREFFRIAGLGALGAAGASLTSKLGRSAGPELERLPAFEPLTAERWAMVVDVRVCLEEGFEKNLEACRKAHNVPVFDDPSDSVKWIWGETYEHAFPEQVHDYMYQDLENQKLPVFCNHCDKPPCTQVCPTQATWRREDGVVMMDWHRCIGCRYCMAACPYGSRSFNWRDPRPHIEEITPRFPTRERGVVEKCNFCEERLAEGELPACVEVSQSDPRPAMIFGDLEDPDSPVRKILRERHAIRRKPGLGTQPEVFYVL